MADLQSHKNQADHNLDFLVVANNDQQENWDWQVTIAFYAGVHLINAHLARSVNLHYRTHTDVNEAIDFGNSTSLARLPEEVYLQYRALFNLSRRSRYLIHENNPKADELIPHLTHERHFKKAIKYLDRIIDYMREKYSIDCQKRPIRCLDIKQNTLNNFNVVQ